jgi:hypothetical protein
MADIKQATKWLMEDHTVQRVSHRGRFNSLAAALAFYFASLLFHG